MTPPSEVADLHARLLAVRLVDAVRVLEVQARPALHRTGFARAWDVMRAFVPGGLFRAVQTPLMHAWVMTVESLIRCGAHIRYPEAHLSRHLKDFARVVLANASDAPDGASGEIALLGRDSVPLARGTALLWLDGPSLCTLRWRISGEVVRLECSELGLDVELVGDLATGPGSGRLRRVPSMADLLVDVWTNEYVGPEREGDTTGLSDRLAACVAGLDERGRLGTLSVITVPRPLPWIAGVARLPIGPPSSTVILELAQADRLWRFLEISRFVEGRDVASSFVTSDDVRAEVVWLGARIAAADQLGRECVPADAARWCSLVERLRAAPEGEALVERFLSEVEGHKGMPVSPAISEPPQPEAPSNRSSSEMAIPELWLPKAARILRKTRAAMREEVDWSAIDALSLVEAGELGFSRDMTIAVLGRVEEQDWVEAMVAYIAGDFERCSAALRACIMADTDVEQYWLLLAFCERHLARQARFEQIVFDGVRRLEALSVSPNDGRLG